MNPALYFVVAVVAIGVGTLALLGGLVVFTVFRNLRALRKARREQK